MLILDGKKVALEETKKLKDRVSLLKNKPKLGIIQVGNLSESNKYISNKIKKANEIGINSEWIKYDKNITENELLSKINDIKNNFDGLIVQLPLPSHINKQLILNSIDLDKDIDGLSEKNMNNFYNDIQPNFCPATARAIFLLLESYKVNLNQNIMIIGESNLVGKPIKKLLSKFAKNIESRNKESGIAGSNLFDILVVAIGDPNFIKSKDVKQNSIIVDVGITITKNNEILGDVDFNDVKDKVFAISPVPGGVGPLTVICLLKNLIDKLESVL